jgi:hypothetical protein
MAKKPVTAISDKLTKVNESFTVNMYDNGFMIDLGGRDSDDNWKTIKLICSTPSELVTHINNILELERAE